MNLAIVGYGKMGRMIESLAGEYGAEVKLVLDLHNNSNHEGMTESNFRGIDAAIEFTTPDTVTGNIDRLSNLGVNVVVGTTGWLGEKDRVRKMIEERKTGLVWSPNFSIGVNAFFRIVSEAARLMSTRPEYEAWAWEIHHSAKKDAPSGTLLQLVEQMKQAGYSAAVDVSSSRAGKVPGTHEIGFDSAADTITLRHTARSREGFARGALTAAKWIVGKQGFHEFSDIVFS